jgi:hypothetical protein
MTLACVAEAQAGSHPIAIDWIAPDGCPRAEQLRAEIHRLLGGEPPPDSERRVAAQAVVTRAGERWRLTLRIEAEGSTGERSLESGDCETLAQATALVVALAFDPERVAAQSDDAVPEQPTPEGDGERAPEDPPPVPVPQRTPPRGSDAPPDAPRNTSLDATSTGSSEREVEITLGVALAGDTGALSSPAAGGGPTFGIVYHWLRIEASGVGWLPQAAASETRASAGGDFTFLSAALDGSVLLLLEPVEIGPYAGLEIGRMHAEGFGVDRPGEGSIVWAAARVGVGAAWSFTPLMALRLQLGAVVPFDRPRWILDNVGLIHRPGPVTGRLSLGLELRL